MVLLFKGIETEESVHHAIEETREKLEEAFQQNINRAMELGILPKKDPNLESALLMSLIEGMLIGGYSVQYPFIQTYNINQLRNWLKRL